MSQKAKIHSSDSEDKSNISISPLAISILAGPGTIVAAMNNVTNASFVHIGIIIFIFTLMIYLTYLAFYFSDLIVKKIGTSLISVIGKLMGLVLSIIGTGMVVDGIKLTFKL
jgi:multiple antibiotic resistance protein